MRGRRAPLCRVGRSNEPAKAGGAAVVGRASGFLETEACTTRNLAARLGFTLAQTSLRKPSRAKQEPDDLTVRLWEGQDTPAGDTNRRDTACNRVSNGSFGSDLGERFVDDALEADGTFVQIVARDR